MELSDVVSAINHDSNNRYNKFKFIITLIFKVLANYSKVTFFTPIMLYNCLILLEKNITINLFYNSVEIIARTDEY